MKHLGVRNMRYTGVLAGAHISFTVIAARRSCYNEEEVVQRLGLARMKIEEPFQVEVANGDIMLVTECTINLALKVGEWTENICLNIVPLIGHQVLLGTSWLGKHNPNVDRR